MLIDEKSLVSPVDRVARSRPVKADLGIVDLGQRATKLHRAVDLGGHDTSDGDGPTGTAVVTCLRVTP